MGPESLIVAAHGAAILYMLTVVPRLMPLAIAARRGDVSVAALSLLVVSALFGVVQKFVVAVFFLTARTMDVVRENLSDAHLALALISLMGALVIASHMSAWYRWRGSSAARATRYVMAEIVAIILAWALLSWGAW